MHELKVSHFAATTDDKGCVYIYSTYDELTKNHQTDSNTADGRMYSIPDDHMCPVKSFMKYKRHLNNKCDRLFQRPSTKPNSITWYDNIPLGHNTIGSFMTKISEKAVLSKRYTNHSLRATSVHVLDASGKYANRHIMSVTGHRAETSLKTYTGYTAANIKKSMSDTISESLRVEIPPKKTDTISESLHGEVPPKKIQCTRNCTTTNNSEINIGVDIAGAILQPITHSQFDTLLNDLNSELDAKDGFNELLVNLDVDNIENINPHIDDSVKNINNIGPIQNTQNISSNMWTVNNRQVFPYPFITNCGNVTINYNFGK